MHAVAKARGLSVTAVTNLVKSQIHPKEWGFLGAEYVDVLTLNEALAKLG